MCDICMRNPCLSKCPNYKPAKSKHYCSVCNEGIQKGEEYIVNIDGEYAHWECVSYARDLASFFGCQIREMEDE